MRKVAIVGNIASGKSEVKKILLDNGFNVLDTDNVCHKLLDSDEVIKNSFLNYDVFDDGKISREKLGKLVFNNELLLKKLESILHPKVRDSIVSFFEYHSNEKYVFVEIPLLFETGMEDLFDDILFVYASDEIRLNRLINRNSFSMEYAKQRMNAQLSQDEKMKKASVIIKNESTIDYLEQELCNLFMQ